MKHTDMNLDLAAVYGGMHGLLSAVANRMEAEAPDDLARISRLIEGGTARMEMRVEVTPALVHLLLRLGNGDALLVATLPVPVIADLPSVNVRH